MDRGAVSRYNRMGCSVNLEMLRRDLARETSKLQDLEYEYNKAREAVSATAFRIAAIQSFLDLEESK